jgi:hypothetical protein
MQLSWSLHSIPWGGWLNRKNQDAQLCFLTFEYSGHATLRESLHFSEAQFSHLAEGLMTVNTTKG